MRRTRHQQGSLIRVKHKQGDVWAFRWRETDASGKRVRRCSILGSLRSFPTRAAAQKEADKLRLSINAGRHTAAVSFGDLAAHYVAVELPENMELSRKSHSHRVTVIGYLRRWVLPEWAKVGAQEIVPIDVERWFGSLLLSNGTKAKIRNIMSAVFRHGLRQGLLPRAENFNPMKLVRQSAASSRDHVVLSAPQVLAIVSWLREPVKTMAILAAVTGLRISELLGLKWQDVDVVNREIVIRRSFVFGQVGSCKSKASRTPVPMDDRVAALLERYRRESIYADDSNWVFASPGTNGHKPYWQSSLRRWHLLPAAKKAGISAPVGWHTFRRTLATLLNANRESVKTQQELLRHSSSSITLDYYSRALTPEKRAAHGKIVDLLLPGSTAVQ